MMIADARDNKALYEDVFKEFYDWGKQISISGIAGVNGEPDLMPFKVVHNSDMKAQWILSNKGGGCRTTRFFALFAPAREINRYRSRLVTCFAIVASDGGSVDVFIIRCAILLELQLYWRN
jgi:hypothetical protein